MYDWVSPSSRRGSPASSGSLSRHNIFVLGIDLDFAHRPVPDAGEISQRNALKTNLLSPVIRSARFSFDRRC